MAMAVSSPFQPSLFDAPSTDFDRSYSRVERIVLEEGCWIDFAQAWVGGADRLFEQVLATQHWGQRERWMYARKVREPRLTAHWHLSSGQPPSPPVLESIRQSLTTR